MKMLTKKQALTLLPLIVDDEASEDDKVAFFSYIQKDEEVKKKYESLLLVKQLIKTKYSREKAPDHLKDRIREMIHDMEWEENEFSKVDCNISTREKKSVGGGDSSESDHKRAPIFNLMKPARYLVAAMVIFFFSLLTIEVLDKTSTGNLSPGNHIEEMALSHFNTGDHVTASIASYQPISLDHASEILEEEMAHEPRLPIVNGAELKQVYFITFADGYTTPVLEFYQSDVNETVHVFTFRLDDLEKKSNMRRDPEAVKLCKTYDDYHVKNINGKHVVSWKWGDYWYTAVSNHNGNDLIALVEPQDSSWEDNYDSGIEW